MSSTGPKRSIREAAKGLYALGGARRFYRGLGVSDPRYSVQTRE